MTDSILDEDPDLGRLQVVRLKALGDIGLKLANGFSGGRQRADQRQPDLAHRAYLKRLTQFGHLENGDLQHVESANAIIAAVVVCTRQSFGLG